MLQLSVSALFYLEDSRKIHLRGVRARRSKDTRRRAPQRVEERERERESRLWLFYLYVYLSLGLSYVNWASQECCLFYLKSSLRSWDLLLFHFCGLFPSLSCSRCHLDSFSLFYLPNRRKVPPKETHGFYEKKGSAHQLNRNTRLLLSFLAPNYVILEFQGASLVAQW